MKTLTLIPLAILVGFIAGSWSLKDDLRRLSRSDEADDGKARIARKAESRETSSTKPPIAPASPAAFDTFAKLTQIPERTKIDEESPVAESSFDLGSRIEEAAELWRVRVELAKVQWKEKLQIDDSAAFDETVAAMNAAVRETMSALATEIERVGTMTPELGLRLMGDLSQTMASAYDALGDLVGEERRDEVSMMPVWEFIDPSVAEPLKRVQDKVEWGRHP